jgi:hypothetical protein
MIFELSENQKQIRETVAAPLCAFRQRILAWLR